MESHGVRRHNGVPVDRLVPLFVLVVALFALFAGGCSRDSGALPNPPPVPSTPGTASLAAASTDWTTFGHDLARTAKASSPRVRPDLPPPLHVQLDGPVYGQPLLIGDTVLAATEDDSVYAFSALDGSLIWRSHLAEPFQPHDCGNVQPLGITGTPVYDPASRLVYAATEDSSAHHVLFALDAASGRVVRQVPIDPPVGVRDFAQQRAALALWRGHVFVAFGGLYGDCGTYTGAVASVDTADTASGAVRWYEASSDGRGGIWAPGAPVAAADRLYFSVGNGSAESPDQPYDNSDSVIALSADDQRLDLFAPSDWAADNQADEDLGSMNPALVAGRIVIAGKSRHGYTLDPTHLGGVVASGAAFDGCAAFGSAAVDGDVAYLPCSDGTRAVRIAADGTASILWHASVPANGQPTLGGGYLWVTDWDHGTLYALDPATGQTAGQVATGRLPHFAAPSMAGRRLFVGTMDGVDVFSANVAAAG